MQNLKLKYESEWNEKKTENNIFKNYESLIKVIFKF